MPPADLIGLERRVAVLERKFDFLDQHGTRGIGVLQVQVGDVKQDLGKLEEKITNLATAWDKRRGNNWQIAIAVILALIPLYVLLFLTVGK